MNSLENIWTPTPLYNLPLLATQDGDPESLYSHILRLAFAHRVAPYTLAANFVNIRPTSAYGLTECLYLDGYHLVGATTTVRANCNLLEQATGGCGMERGTLLPLSKFAAGQGLISIKHRVCVSCIRADLAAKRPAFGRLLWRIALVKCCPIHGELLTELGRCDRSHTVREKRSRPVRMYGVCFTCGTIGYPCHAVGAKASDDELSTAVQCRDLIAIASTLPPDAHEVSKRALKKLSGRFNRGYAGIAAHAGVSKSLLSRWLNEPSAAMKLETFLAVARVIGVDLVRLFRGELAQASSSAKFTANRIKPERRKLQPATLKKLLLDTLQSNDFKTLSEVSRECGADRRLLKSIDRSTCEALLRRESVRAALEHERSWESAWQECSAIVKQLQDRQKKVSLRSATDVDGQPWFTSQARSRILLTLVSRDPEQLIRKYRLPAFIADRLRTRATSKAPVAGEAVDA